MNNFNSKPLVSIITICRNSEKTILKTIESVINQTYKNIEYIVIDGLSEDNTISEINKYKSKISEIIIEKDDGIYDAFNKGLKKCSGDLIGFVNSDDILLPNAIEILVNYHNKLLPTGIPIYSAKNLLEVNCAEGKMRYVTSVYYGSTNGKGKLISREKGNGEWFYDAPGTTGYQKLEAICKY